MPARPTESTRAVLLRSVAYGESDRIVTLLTEAHGRVSLLARSARVSKRRFGSGALEPFGLLDVELSLGPGEVGRLASSRLVRGFPRLLGSLERMALAGAGLETVRNLLPHRESDPRFLETVLRFFEELEDGDPVPGLRVALELRVLEMVGLMPRLDTCGRCGRFALSRAGLFDPALGALVCRACGGGPLRLGGSTRAVMLACQDEDWYVAGRAFGPLELREAQTALRAFLDRHGGSSGAEEE